MQFSPVTLLILKLQFIILRLIPIIIGIAVIWFLVNLVRYGLSNSATDKEEIKGVIINGVILLFVMVSVWGLVSLFFQFFNISPWNNSIGIDYINPIRLIR